MPLRQYGEEGLPEDTIFAYTEGHAGQSLAAYAPHGLTIHHTGDANDYVGKVYQVEQLLLMRQMKSENKKLSQVM